MKNKFYNKTEFFLNTPPPTTKGKYKLFKGLVNIYNSKSLKNYSSEKLTITSFPHCPYIGMKHPVEVDIRSIKTNCLETKKSNQNLGFHIQQNRTVNHPNHERNLSNSTTITNHESGGWSNLPTIFHLTIFRITHNLFLEHLQLPFLVLCFLFDSVSIIQIWRME